MGRADEIWASLLHVYTRMCDLYALRCEFDEPAGPEARPSMETDCRCPPRFRRAISQSWNVVPKQCNGTRPRRQP